MGARGRFEDDRRGVRREDVGCGGNGGIIPPPPKKKCIKKLQLQLLLIN